MKIIEDYPFSLSGKKILVTGASSGIGKSAAIWCNKMGADVILIARDQKRLKETYDILKVGNNTYYSLDLKTYEVIEPAVYEYVEKYGKIDGFIHAAGVEETIPMQLMSPKRYEELFSINVISGFEIARIISKKKYINPDGGSFIFISSIMGTLGQSGKIGYCSSKGALISGAKAMALELAVKKIRVNTISPAIVETELTRRMFTSLTEEAIKAISEMHPLGFGKPDDIAFAAIYLLSDAAKWVTGSNLIIDGGYCAK
ncbi:MAG TPA: SDR family oxidoreductase [Bacteroidales bacterium]|nr:SDR family oxidoreductase [Bacteroidales bacterium]